jgi:hypothetical protein
MKMSSLPKPCPLVFNGDLTTMLEAANLGMFTPK